MSYQDEKQARLRRQVSKQAITLAVQGRWQESIAINKNIIENFPHDVDAYNRLGKAYMEIGDYAKAKEAYSHALQLDQFNTIAKKNLTRLARFGGGAEAKEGTPEKAEPRIFIEETGKASVVNLYQIAPASVVVRMTAGDKVVLKPEGPNLRVESRGEFLGLVPPKEGKRLIKLMKGGNQYTAAVVSPAENYISIIIREIYRDPSQAGQVSFPGKRAEELQPYVSDRIFRHEFEEEELVEAAGLIGAEGEEEAETPEELPEGIEEEPGI